MTKGSDLPWVPALRAEDEVQREGGRERACTCVHTRVCLRMGCSSEDADHSEEGRADPSQL